LSKYSANSPLAVNYSEYRKEQKKKLTHRRGRTH
jgi:hypothetical protein